VLAFWTGAAVLVLRGVRHFRGRWGYGPVLLVWLPVATLVMFELVSAGERVLGALY
jgi:hypothetical protein